MQRPIHDKTYITVSDSNGEFRRTRGSHSDPACERIRVSQSYSLLGGCGCKEGVICLPCSKLQKAGDMLRGAYKPVHRYCAPTAGVLRAASQLPAPTQQFRFEFAQKLTWKPAHQVSKRYRGFRWL